MMRKNEIEMKKDPPLLASWILQHILDTNMRYAAMGDFDERFFLIEEQKGMFGARLF